MLPDTRNERDLVDRARTGDREAMGAIFDLYLSRIYRYVLAHVGSPAEAEDIAQEVFLRIVEAIGRFEWRDVEFSAWVFRIARNQMISHHRRHGARAASVSAEEVEIEDAQPGPERLVEHALTVHEVYAACERLPQSQREVIALRFGSGLSVRETAQSLGKSENNVKVLQHKAIARLQKLLGAR
jgi:RNA polymerase sigma-70 factor (ECF subfamily)